MKKGKTYSNPYTILEKVRQGKIETHYKGKDGLFGKLNFYKKPDLIHPEMYYMDEKRVKQMVEKYISHPDNVKDLLASIAKGTVTTDLVSKTKTKMEELYGKCFAKHMVSDIFKLFYHQVDELDFEERQDSNKGRYKMLEQANNPVAKIMTQQSHLKSSIFTRNVVSYFLAQMAYQELQEPPPPPSGGKGKGKDKGKPSAGDGKGNPDQNEIDKTEEMAGKLPSNNKGLQQMMDKAMDQCKKIDQAMSDEEQKDVFDNSDQFSFGRTGDVLKEIEASLSQVKLSMHSLKDNIKKIMNYSANRLSMTEKTTWENILDSDNIGGLEDFVNLHPRLRRFTIEDVMIKDIEKSGKVSVYLDISGSMQSSCGVSDVHGKVISKLDFSKAFIVKLLEMNMLHKLFLYNTKVHSRPVSRISIATIGADGGTNTDVVLRHMKDRPEKAIIITDAEDSVGQYDERALFIGTRGANFRGFTHLKDYVDNKQIIEFDGTRVRMVGMSGRGE